MDLRDYKAAIKESINYLKGEDKNWDWKLKSVTKGKILIRWGYLDYIGQKGDFEIRLMVDGPDVSLIGVLNNDYSWADNDDRADLFCWIGDKHWHDTPSLETGVRMMVCRIGHMAHARY